MEGLLPLLLHAIKKHKQPANVYRCLSNNSTGRSYHLLLAEGSSDQWNRSPPPPPAVDLFTVGSYQLTLAGKGLNHRRFASEGEVKN